MDLQERLQFVTHHTRAAMLLHATLETCILTTKMLCHIIPELVGVNVMPIGVGVIGCNAAGRASIESGAIVTKNKEGGEVVLMCSHRGEKADQPGEWWGGHLVLIADNRFLVDGSADQFNTPEVGFRTHPFVADLGSSEDAYEWMMSHDMLGFECPEGACVGYEPHLEDFSYRPSMDWDETKPGDKMYDWVAERVSGLLEAYEGVPVTPRLLPALPETLSRRRGSPMKAIAAREFQSAIALGYTKEELLEKTQREEERTAAKAERHPAKTFNTQEEAEAATEAETLEAMRQMEPKLREASERGGQNWFGPERSPLVSSPPS